MSEETNEATYKANLWLYNEEGLYFGLAEALKETKPATATNYGKTIKNYLVSLKEYSGFHPMFKEIGDLEDVDYDYLGQDWKDFLK